MPAVSISRRTCRSRPSGGPARVSLWNSVMNRSALTNRLSRAKESSPARDRPAGSTPRPVARPVSVSSIAAGQPRYDGNSESSASGSGPGVWPRHLPRPGIRERESGKLRSCFRATEPSRVMRSGARLIGVVMASEHRGICAGAGPVQALPFSRPPPSRQAGEVPAQRRCDRAVHYRRDRPLTPDRLSLHRVQAGQPVHPLPH